MGKYKINEETKTIYKAELRGNKTIISYEFEKVDNGWFIDKTIHQIEAAFPKKESMWLPNELVEQILLVENAKSDLT